MKFKGNHKFVGKFKNHEMYDGIYTFIKSNKKSAVFFEKGKKQIFLKWITILKNDYRILWDNRRRLDVRDKIKKFTYSSCSIINISINTHENNSCPRGEIVDTKDQNII